MDTYEIIKQLCDEKGIRLSVLASGIGVRSSVFTELKMGRTKKLSVSTLGKIADYYAMKTLRKVQRKVGFPDRIR